MALQDVARVMLKNESNKCACPHCGNNIEFGKDVAGMEIACPHCNDPLTLPESRICEPHYSDTPITQNVILCPNCRESSTTYGKEFAGTQVTCHGCDSKMRIPTFSDAPKDVLEQFESIFAERKDDAEFDGDSGYHEGEHEFQVNQGWGLVGAVCLLVVLITAIGVHFVPDQMMREETREFVSAVGFIAFVVTIGVVMVIRRVWSARRIALLGSMRFVTPLRKQKLAMGEALQGQISIALKKPLENCSLGLSLVLLRGTKDLRTSALFQGDEAAFIRSTT